MARIIRGWHRPCCSLVVLAAACALASPAAMASTEEQSLLELRNTVVNLLQALVEQGVMTREKAQALVADAQTKASAETAERTAEENASVRVTYVPEIVKEDIRRQVAEEVRPLVVADVTQRAKDERWGVPAALPDWLSRVRWSGDVRVRWQADLFASDNLPFTYKDYLTINDRGGEARAGLAAFANTTEDRYRTRVQARLALSADLGGGLSAGARLVTGNLRDPVSTNQTLGTASSKYSVGFDQVYLRWDGRSRDEFNITTLQAGRIPNPWLSTDLMFDRDLTFEGFAATGRLPIGARRSDGSNVFLTLGVLPLEEVELSSKDKTLLAAQLGADLRLGDGHRLKFAGAYYDFRNVQGRRNTPESTLLDFTAPRFLQRGNSLFDIRNTIDPTANLYALAGRYRIANAIISYDGPSFGRYRFFATADYVDNVGWSSSDVLNNTGSLLEERTKGYQLELGVGDASVRTWGQWRAYFAYRYAERDSVLDAFTDSDLRGGGTDIEGFIVGADLGVLRNSYFRARYLTADELDGVRATPTSSFPFGQDTIQLDLMTHF